MTTEFPQEPIKDSSVPHQKKKLRKFYKSLRSSLSPSRRNEAETALWEAVYHVLQSKTRVLSYCSFQEELCTQMINQYLATSKTLLLPKMEKDKLRIYHVKDLSSQLTKNPWGLLEPIPSLCDEVEPMRIEFAFVPGLAFDDLHNRLGYGKGFYDRFLKELQPFVDACGIGFKEQLHQQPLPTAPFDFQLSNVILV